MFVTGGIGGVHRGAQQTFDESADIAELARSGVAVICAGEYRLRGERYDVDINGTQVSNQFLILD